MSASETQAVLPLGKLPWLQYSLRTLLLLVVLVSVGLSWFVIQLHQSKRQRKAAEAIMKSGGVVQYSPTPETLRVPLSLRKLLGDDFFADVVGVSVVDDAQLGHLSHFDGLQGVELDGPAITDAGLARSQGLTQLKLLSFNCTRVTDEGMKNLREALPECKIERYPANMPQPQSGSPTGSADGLGVVP